MFSALLTFAPMNVKQLRAQNLALLVKYKANGKQRVFADTYELSPSHISQMIQGHREMGDKFARKVESLLALDPGAMDRPLDIVGIAPKGSEDTHAARLAALQGLWPQLSDDDTAALLNTARLFLGAKAAQKKPRKGKAAA